MLDMKRKGTHTALTLGPDVSEDANDHLLLSNDADELTESICRYLVIAASMVKPLRYNKQKISASTVLERRTTMLYWITKGRKSRVKIDCAAY